ncbi:RNA ligase/6-phosphofructo-2-kinase/NACHT domain/AAA domain containing protein [Novymonas esmeraldas]|uniref:RNA ligase/6-phosphofructo-2-kinase/NACHT domain/AAA domain containing protein n=1 Tax=Novymonas esmeraldas TaxID=1808958 RepID=A0AAW0FE56_9TRYP
MDVLKRECWFHKEESAAAGATRIDVEVLDGYVARGRASLASVALSDGREVASVSVREASQGDVSGLACGARSLLVRHDDGGIVCRGVNKFFDVGEVDDAWVADPSLWAGAYDVWAVRKMAGFIVTLFSLDGTRVEVMSKHALAGPHVSAACELLRRMSDEHRTRLAADLFEWEACAACECIQRAQDFTHPVLEEALFDQQLVLIAVQRRALLREESLRFSELSAVAGRWGLRCAPGVALSDAAALQRTFAAAAAWEATYPEFGECQRLAEGFVLLVEAAGATEAVAHHWCRPLRLKLKTAKYVVLRAFRSLICGDSRPQHCLYHDALVAWLQPKTAAEIRQLVDESGVCALNSRFEAGLQAQQRVRHRDSQCTVGHALARLQRMTARHATPRGRCPLTVVVLCGLPGAGKTTLSASVARLLSAEAAATSSPFHFVVHLSRDAVSRAVAADLGITEESSKHKRRRVRALVHQTLSAQVREVARFSAETEQAGLLLFDACNATLDSRRVWRRCTTALLQRYAVVHVACSDAAVLAQRAACRGDHEVLRSAAEAQQALYAVGKMFQPPSAEEAPWCVDTAACTTDEAATALLNFLVSGSAPVSGAERCRVVTVAELREEKRQSDAQLLHDLLGVSEGTMTDLAGLGRSAARCRAAPLTVSLQLRLSCSVEWLRQTAAQLLSAMLDPPSRPETWLAAAGRALFHRVVAALGGSPALPCAPASGELVRGHAKWLRGWLLGGRGSSGPAEVEAALHERFEVEPVAPHVTLLHPRTAAAPAGGEEAVSAFLSQANMQVGQEMTVHATSLLLDRHGVCFGVALMDGRHHQGGGGDDGGGTRLHVTVGTAAHVPAAYTGGMFAAFDQLQSENELLAVEQRAAAGSVSNRSQRKYHNFLECRLSTPLPLRGVVEVCRT